MDFGVICDINNARGRRVSQDCCISCMRLVRRLLMVWLVLSILWWTVGAMLPTDGIFSGGLR